jgi:arylsulfotransferase ASST
LLTRAQLLERAGRAALAVLVAPHRPARGRALAGEAAMPPPGTVQSFVTEPDLQPPAITVRHAAARPSPGSLFLAPSSGPGQRGTMIATDAGEVVWFHSTAPNTAMNFRAAVYRGRPVLTWWEGRSKHGFGLGEHVVFDSSYRELLRFPAGGGLQSDLHELIVTPEGTALLTAYDVRTADLRPAGGRRGGRVFEGVAQELELPSGRLRLDWRSLDHVGVGESYGKVGNPYAYDYFHMNSIEVAGDGDLLVSARNTWALYKLERGSGKVVWRLGGKKSDFAMGPGTRFAWQHDARLHDGDRLLTLFDNEASPKVLPQSRVLALALDQKRMRAALARRWVHTPPLSAHALGSAQLQAGGSMLVGWGTEPYFSEYAADGTLLYDAKLPDGGQNYRTLRFPWRGTPAKPPRLAARATAAGTVLYASWNGATDVARWLLLTGPDAGRLEQRATVPKHGFETALALPAPARYAAVVALAADGSRLGRSAAVELPR